MVKKLRFREFPIYRDAIAFRRSLKDSSAKILPAEERFALKLQLWRALDSIVLNIAEGADRGTDRDFAHYLNTAHTSLNEVVACLDLAHSDGYLGLSDHGRYLKEAEQMVSQLTAFRRSLLQRPTK
jgi:four helix bundle protein